jgi:hypothetical protein
LACNAISRKSHQDEWLQTLDINPANAEDLNKVVEPEEEAPED